MGSPEYDLAMYELALNAEQTAGDLRAKELNAKYQEIGEWSAKDFWEAMGELTESQWDEFSRLFMEMLRDHPPEQAHDDVFRASRTLRAWLAETLTEEA